MNYNLDLRKIDALVAEHVMGWRVEKYMTTIPKPTGAGMRPGSAVIEEIPRYTSDISTAWEVIERLHPEFTFSLDYLSSGRWTITFYSGEAHGLMSTDSAPLAICLAALRAKGIDCNKERVND